MDTQQDLVLVPGANGMGTFREAPPFPAVVVEHIGPVRIDRRGSDYQATCTAPNCPFATGDRLPYIVASDMAKRHRCARERAKLVLVDTKRTYQLDELPPVVIPGRSRRVTIRSELLTVRLENGKVTIVVIRGAALLANNGGVGAKHTASFGRDDHDFGRVPAWVEDILESDGLEWAELGAVKKPGNR